MVLKWAVNLTDIEKKVSGKEKEREIERERESKKRDGEGDIVWIV